MQEEVNEKTISLCIKGGKITAQILKAALIKLLAEMDKAKELLQTTECSMKEICARTGYSDPNYFSRSFKKNVGVTPTEYKENRGKGQEQGNV